MIQIQEKFTQYCLLRFLEWFAHLCHSDWLVDRKVIFFKLAILTSQVLICWLTIYVNLLNTFGNSHVVHSRLCCGWIWFWKDCHSRVYCTKEHIWKGLFLRKFLKRTWVCLDIHRLFLATWNTHSDVYMYLH